MDYTVGGCVSCEGVGVEGHHSPTYAETLEEAASYGPHSTANENDGLTMSVTL